MDRLAPALSRSGGPNGLEPAFGPPPALEVWSSSNGDGYSYPPLVLSERDARLVDIETARLAAIDRVDPFGRAYREEVVSFEASHSAGLAVGDRLSVNGREMLITLIEAGRVFLISAPQYYTTAPAPRHDDWLDVFKEGSGPPSNRRQRRDQRFER